MNELTEIRRKLGEIEEVYGAVVRTMGDMTASLGVCHDKMDALLKWAQTPPPSDLPNALRKLSAAVNAMNEGLDALPDRIAERLGR